MTEIVFSSGNYLEQGVERIVDQVVNPKVASVFIPQVEDLVYNYLGITRKKTVNNAETSNDKTEHLLPTDLEAVSPGSVKSNDDKNEAMEVDTNVPVTNDMEDDKNIKPEEKDQVKTETNHIDSKTEPQEESVSELTSNESSSIDKSSIPLPSEEIKLENIPPPENSPPKKVELEKIELPKEINYSTDIPLPDEIPKDDKDYFKAINSDDDDSSSDSSLRRNMSPLTPIRNFNNENSCDAQQAFDNDSLDGKNDDKKEPSSFRFTIEATENCTDSEKTKKPTDQLNLAYQFNNQVNINSFNTPMYDDSSNSNLLQIDYESDANSKVNSEQKPSEAEVSEDLKKERKSDDKKSSHKSSHRSRDSNKHSSKDRRSDSKHSTSRDSSRHEKKSKDDSKSKSSYKDSSRDKTDKKDSKDSSRHSHKTSSNKDSKYKSSSSSQRNSGKSSDEKRSSHRDKSDRSSEKSSKDKSRDSKSSRSEKDRKSSKSKHDEKDKEKKEKKDSDDHYSVSGRGNPNRRSTDRDSNDGSSSSKGSHNPSSGKSSESKKDAKSGSSKSDNMSTSSEGRSPNDRELTLQEKEKEVIDMLQPKPIVRLETHLETPIASPPRILVPEVQIKKPKFANNLEEAKKLMKMRKYLDEEQKRMNQEAALLLEFQANVRPSLSQIYSSIPGPELEFACVTNTIVHTEQIMLNNDGHNTTTFITDQNYPEDEGFSDHVEDDVPSTLTVKEVEESIEIINEELNNKAKAHATEDIISKESYESPMIENLTRPGYSQNVNPENIDIKANIENSDVCKENVSVIDNKEKTAYFEVTVIAEEVTDDEGNQQEAKITEVKKNPIEEKVHSEQNNFHYFAETEKYNAELERDRFSKFLKDYTVSTTNKIYLINCDPYEESIVREVLDNFGHYEIVNYQRNGHLKLPKSKNIVKNVNLSNEVSLPVDKESENDIKSITESVFSPVKSECSFELSNDYDAKLEEMVNKTSRQEIMEIILGSVIADSPSKMPKIDYLTDSNIEGGSENLKRKHDMETVNRPVLAKMRRLSIPDQISSTTEGK